MHNTGFTETRQSISRNGKSSNAALIFIWSKNHPQKTRKHNSFDYIVANKSFFRHFTLFRTLWLLYYFIFRLSQTEKSAPEKQSKRSEGYMRRPHEAIHMRIATIKKCVGIALKSQPNRIRWHSACVRLCSPPPSLLTFHISYGTRNRPKTNVRKRSNNNWTA